VLQNFGEYKSSKNQGALSPIYQALQLNFAHDFFGKLVITEGITDYYFWSIIQKHSPQIPKDLKIIPGSGAGQSSTLISLAIPYSEDFLIILDNDKAGKEAEKKYLKEFGTGIKSKLIFYDNGNSKCRLEDLLSAKDQNKILELTRSKNIKRALGLLFYDFSSQQDQIINELDGETSKNLEKLVNQINDLWN
jgi:hypothetical protein